MILGIIPARGGSKGIIRKNLYPLAGKLLILYTIEEALKSNLDDLIITTDDYEIAQYHKSVLRPPELAQDDTLMVPVIQHALAFYGQGLDVVIDAVMLLQPTSPLRIADDINAAIRKFDEYNTFYGDCDSLISVCEGVHPVKCYDGAGTPFLNQEPYDKNKHKCYVRNGAIFIIRKDLIDKGQLIGERPLFYEMPKGRSIDIDTLEDMMIAEALLKVSLNN